MGYYNKYGRAEVNSDHPRAFAVCDRCGIWSNLYKLRWQMQWNATQLYNQRILVCDSCYDTPQEQLRAVILPPDPPPLTNIRPEFFRADEVDFMQTQDKQNILTQDAVPIVGDKASENFSETPPQVPPVPPPDE